MAFIGIATSLIQHLATLTGFIALDLTTRCIQPFQKSCESPVFSNNYIGDSKTALNEKGEILIKNIKKAKNFNSQIKSVTASLGLFCRENGLLSQISPFSGSSSILKLKFLTSPTSCRYKFADYSAGKYSETSEQRTPTGLKKFVRYEEVPTIGRQFNKGCHIWD